MQHLPVYIFFVAKVSIECRISIRCIANNGTSRVGKVYSYLMCSSGFNFALKQRKCLSGYFVLCQCFIVCYGSLAVVIIHTHLSGLLGIFNSYKLLFYGSSWFWHFPCHNGVVDFFYCMRLKQRKHSFQGIFLQSNNHTTACVSVNSVHQRWAKCQAIIPFTKHIMDLFYK